MGSSQRYFSKLLVGSMLTLVMVAKSYSKQIEDYDSLLLASGKNIEGMSGRYTGYHDQHALKNVNPAE
jgi:hypothetical protein